MPNALLKDAREIEIVLLVCGAARDFTQLRACVQSFPAPSDFKNSVLI
jgi:hypothetical protein